MVSKPRLIGAPEKFILEVHPSRDPLAELVANVWSDLAIFCNSSRSTVRSVRNSSPVVASKVYFHFPSRTPNRYSPRPQESTALRPVRNKRAVSLPILGGRDPEEIGDRRAQIHMSADGPATLTAGKEARIPERDIHLFLIYSKLVAPLIVGIGKRFAMITCNHDKGNIC
jgi:hypothetical protein